MKKQLFIFLFITAHLFFIFSQIHKQSQFIQASYEKQKYEKRKHELLEKKQTLNYSLKREMLNPAAIKNFAHDSLHMQKINLKQIKPFSHEQPV
jgi:hypothetical protein